MADSQHSNSALEPEHGRRRLIYPDEIWLFTRETVAACDGGVPRCGGLEAAREGAEVHADKSPALGVAGSPFKVVQQRPRVVASHPAALADRLMQSAKMAAEEVHAGMIGGWLTAVGWVVGDPVLGDGWGWTGRPRPSITTGV
jgi:hypothetical protein